MVSAASASTTRVIYSFAGGNDGAYTDTDLVTNNELRLDALENACTSINSV